MLSFFSTLIPLGVLVSHALFVFILIALIYRKSWGAPIIGHIRRNTLRYGLAISALAVTGSLFYSVGLGYEPCELCVWQRIFLFPQLILFLGALKFKDEGVMKYSWRLTVLATLVSLFQVYAQTWGSSLLACTSAGGACLKIFVNAYSYITIPVMSLTACGYLLLLAYIHYKHE